MTDPSAAEALSAEAAWEALAYEWLNGEDDTVGLHEFILRHRPVIEAALDRERAAALSDWPLTEAGSADLRARAVAAIENEVHPANWHYWINLVMMGGPARTFIEMASPTLVIAMLDARSAALPTLEVERLRAALAYAYAEGHREGVGCGHDLSPACRHDGEAWVAEEASYEWDPNPVRAALGETPAASTETEKS